LTNTCLVFYADSVSLLTDTCLVFYTYIRHHISV
jgi:hypothetical protein